MSRFEALADAYRVLGAALLSDDELTSMTKRDIVAAMEVLEGIGDGS